MPERPPDAAAPAGDRSPRGRRAGVLRGIGVVLALGLGAVAVWLIVTSSSQKHLELGVLAGLWGLLIGAFAAFGTRRLARGTAAVDEPGIALAVRPHAEVDRADEAAARRRFEARLEQMLRHEIHTSFAAEIAALRDEVAALRSELLEKVGGQLRLERIETTRVIGSDIEALYREIEKLKHGHSVLSAGPGPDRPPQPAPPVIEPAPVPVAGPVGGPVVAPGPLRESGMTEPIPLVGEVEVPPVTRPERERAEPEQPARPEPQPAGLRSGADDLFASLPRLSEFHDSAPLPTAPARAGAARGAAGKTARPEAAAASPERSGGPERSGADPAGRRAMGGEHARAGHGASGPEPGDRAEDRATDRTEDRAVDRAEGRAAVPAFAPGRHGRPDGPRPGGEGRRRRAAEDGDNVLARILAREAADRR